MPVRPMHSKEVATGRSSPPRPRHGNHVAARALRAGHGVVHRKIQRMTDADITALVDRVRWAAFAFGALFGAVGQRTRFCTMGAIADLVTMGSTERLRQWAAAAAVAVLGFNAMVATGGPDASATIHGSSTLRWLSLAVGGLLFGAGMVLASGCGSRQLVRLGGGSLKALVVLLVLGLSALATLRGGSALLRTQTVDRVTLALPAGQDLPHLLAHATGLPLPLLAALAGGAVALALAAWVLAAPEGRRAGTWVAGLGVGGAVVGLWWVSGRLGFVAEDPRTLEAAFLATGSGRMESLSLVAPIGQALDWALLASDRQRLLSFGACAAFGIVAGAAAAALAAREFRWEGFGGAGDTARHLAGAALMGVGGVTALGCTIGQGLSGVSTLALGSALATAAMAAGAVLALRALERALGG